MKTIIKNKNYTIEFNKLESLIIKDKEGNIKYSAATGSKGYRWLESEMVKELDKEDCIDRSYYDNLVNEAAKTITVYGDLEWFRSDEPYFGPDFIDGRPNYEEEIPFL